LINVFGGKLTTFMALARQVGRAVDRAFGESRPAAEPLFDRRGASQRLEANR
jgi:glycerol-3-phosphate dehydrogenase